MKKIIIFLAFFISSQSFAQTLNQANKAKNVGAQMQQGSNVRAVAPIPPANAPKLTAEEKALLEKNIAEQNDFQNILKNLKPAQQKKFQEINQAFGLKIVEYSKTLNEEITKISKIQNLMTITTFIFKGKLDENPARSSSKAQQDFYQKQIAEYQKLPQDKKILIKKEIMKFRKNINGLEKKRRQEFRALFSKDFNIFRERESDEEIKNDEK